MRDILKSVAFVFLSVALAAACQGPVENGEENTGNKEMGTLDGVSFEIDAEKITATTVELPYSIKMTDAVASAPLEFKLRYSTSEAFGKENTRIISLDKKKTSVGLSGLETGKEYFYEMYVELYDMPYNGVRGSFSTEKITVTVGEPQLGAATATFTGTFAGYSDVDVSELQFKIFVADANVGQYVASPLTVGEDKTFSHTVSGLDIDTKYLYRVQVLQGQGISADSGIKDFTTADPYVSSEKEITATAMNLSQDATANCYIVPASGVYKFKMTKGNSDESVGAVASVRTLWESYGTNETPTPFSLVSATCKIDDYAVIEVPSPFKEGNAVVAAYDSEGKIIWSWHIWLTEDTMTEITYGNEAGVMLDRNLGALSAEKNNVGSLGLFYQWGRKDPFLGSSSTTTANYAVSTRHLKYTKNTSSTSGLAYAIANPHIFILGNANDDWMPQKDNSLWAKDKTIYDPCPAGWRVPDGGCNGDVGENGLEDGIWATAGLPRSKPVPFAREEDAGFVGLEISAPYCTPASWYPAAGSIRGTDANIHDIGIDGVYLSVTAFNGDEPSVTGFLFNFLPSMSAHEVYCGGEKFTRAGGGSVRCCKE